jgi:hypothetical protein
MKEIIKITISGKTIFLDNCLTWEECATLQALADSDVFRKSLDFSDKEIFFSQYKRAVKDSLGITLKPLKIKSVIRLK